MVDYPRLREKMVENQLIRRGINDIRVIEAFRKVPREEFIPKESKSAAYYDGPLSIGLGQTISQPYMVAIMTQALGPDENSKILEIGTGSGYQSAILAELAEKVYSIERFLNLVEYSKKNLIRLGYRNVFVIHADGTLGYEDKALYQGIIVTAGAPEVPASLIEQLDINGRLIIPVGGEYSQVLKKITKTDNGIEEESICSCVFVPLIGKQGWSQK